MFRFWNCSRHCHAGVRQARKAKGSPQRARSAPQGSFVEESGRLVRGIPRRSHTPIRPPPTSLSASRSSSHAAACSSPAGVPGKSAFCASVQTAPSGHGRRIPQATCRVTVFRFPPSASCSSVRHMTAFYSKRVRPRLPVLPSVPTEPEYRLPSPVWKSKSAVNHS